LNNAVEIERNGVVQPEEIADVRESVGWDRLEGTYQETLSRLYSYYTVRTDGRLVGYLGVVSDGIADAMLVDVVIHREYQGKGIGKRLLIQALRELRDDGIRGVQLTFASELEDFYRSVGFRILSGGLIDFKYMEWDPDTDL